MRVAITGGTGTIGTALASALRARGDEVIVLTRQAETRPGQVRWDPKRGVPQVRQLEGIDALVNLTGEPLATRPWTRPRRELLRASRVEATENLLASLARLDEPPVVFVGVGTLGLFGDRGDAWIDDDECPGTGFLAELGLAWEQAHLASRDVLGARAAVLRMGMVMASTGGALPLLVGPMRHGFGGWLGDGRQFNAWISLDDCVRALLHLLDTPACSGPFNGSVPEPSRSRDWVQSLGRACGREVHGHAPKWAVRGALGELADAVFLASTRARPRKLLDAGFTFVDTDIDALLRRIVTELDRPPPS
ncbi:MAG: TIGR01777 family protein [Alphaproteobacteria bacterium]|nr:TIGR01777 family protein [Alphaproteobacteria bacterium]